MNRIKIIQFIIFIFIIPFLSFCGDTTTMHKKKPPIKIVCNPIGVMWSNNAIEEISAYVLYSSTISGDYRTPIYKILLPSDITAYYFPTNSYPEGIYYWILTAIDKVGNESNFSNEVKAGFDYTKPKNCR